MPSTSANRCCSRPPPPPPDSSRHRICSRFSNSPWLRFRVLFTLFLCQRRLKSGTRRCRRRQRSGGRSKYRRRWWRRAKSVWMRFRANWYSRFNWRWLNSTKRSILTCLMPPAHPPRTKLRPHSFNRTFSLYRPCKPVWPRTCNRKYPICKAWSTTSGRSTRLSSPSWFWRMQLLWTCRIGSRSWNKAKGNQNLLSHIAINLNKLKTNQTPLPSQSRGKVRLSV